MIPQSGPIRLLLFLFTFINFVRADIAAFDLSGPPIEVRVTRSGKTLPISRVPNLQPGDRIWVHPDLPEDQSAHYLLVVAFLRGPTNPPPDVWFTKAETWNKRVREEGIVVVVPQDAQQALLFLAPETGGDFSTLRSTVKGKPGVFVRASQDLNQASLDRSRLDQYINAIRQTSENDPKALHDRSVLLARSLTIKLDQQCFDRPVEQQTSCLTQHTDQLVLDDGHSQSMVAALTSGPSSDLIGQLSNTRLAGGGYYSPYVGAVVDLARIMGSLHTATYQYIPALAVTKDNQLNLKLNNPPSFLKPKSVLVVGLPAVEAAQLPPLRAVDPNQVSCLQKPSLVLPVEGAPLVFSTSLAHDFVLQIQSDAGSTIELPAVADAARGGFLIDAQALRGTQVAGPVRGRLHGSWGFQAFDGPVFNLQSANLQSARASQWKVPTVDQSALIVGREDTLHLQSDNAACVENVSVRDAKGTITKANWKLAKPNELEVQLPLQSVPPGSTTILVNEFGLNQPDEVRLNAYAEPGHMDRFVIDVGDQQGVLTGTRLDEVASLDLNGIRFSPVSLSRAAQKDELRLSISSSGNTVQSEQTLVAHVDLKDGRVLDVPATVAPPRPKVALVNKTIETGPIPSAVHLESPDDLPQDGRLVFFFHSGIPETFPRNEKIEVAAAEDSFSVLLSVSDGDLVLQDAHNVLATLDPLKSFGPSAFGPLRFRPVDANGAKGDWQSLVTLVRTPSLKEIRCPDKPDEQCTLTGTKLFLIDSVAADAEFKHTVSIPIGFAETSVKVPRINGTPLYLKLRDDPSVANTVTLPTLPQ
jgi:hypothetical protein